jgi:putative transposase
MMIDNAKLASRHSIRLKEYDYSRDGAYFITACTKERKSLFNVYPELKMIIEDEWESLSTRFRGVMTDAFVVMPNHIHAVIILNQGQRAGASPAPTIGNIIGSYKSLSSNRWLAFIKQNNMNISGAVWQRNYYERVIRTDEELNLIREYVVFNPLKWSCDRNNPNHEHDSEYLKKRQWLEKAETFLKTKNRV